MIQRSVQLPFCRLIIEAPDATYLATDVLGDSTYSTSLDHPYFLRLHQSISASTCETYRRLMFKRGIYLGHHTGRPADVGVKRDELRIFMEPPCATEYSRLTWQFALKLVLTVTALQNNALHLKGVALRKDDDIHLLLGRGRAGKTTAAEKLTHLGYQVISNTHCLIKDGHVWGVNTWTRRRTITGQDEYRLDPSPPIRDGRLKSVTVYEYNNRGVFESRVLPPALAKAFLTYFGAGTANYDLKEDIADIADSTDAFEERHHLLQIELELVDRMVNQFSINYISSDLNTHNSQAAFADYFLRRGTQ